MLKPNLLTHILPVPKINIKANLEPLHYLESLLVFDIRKGVCRWLFHQIKILIAKAFLVPLGENKALLVHSFAVEEVFYLGEARLKVKEMARVKPWG